MAEEKREWGRTKIIGGRHAFRQAMVLRELRRHVWMPAEVLDAGCGDGSMSAALFYLGYRVSAVDASKMCVEKCRQGLAWMAHGEEAAARVLQSGLDSMPFADASFDAVVSGEVLEHVDDDGAAAREIFRVLRPAGTCVVTVPADPKLWGIEDEWAGHLRRYSAESLAEIITAVGFEPISLRRWGWPMTYVYDRYVFSRWLKRRIAAGKANEEAGAAASRLAVKILTLGLSIDRIFIGAPWGIGLIGIFKKPGVRAR